MITNHVGGAFSCTVPRTLVECCGGAAPYSCVASSRAHRRAVFEGLDHYYYSKYVRHGNGWSCKCPSGAVYNVGAPRKGECPDIACYGGVMVGECVGGQTMIPNGGSAVDCYPNASRFTPLSAAVDHCPDGYHLRRMDGHRNFGDFCQKSGGTEQKPATGCTRAKNSPPYFWMERSRLPCRVPWPATEGRMTSSGVTSFSHWAHDQPSGTALPTPGAGQCLVMRPLSGRSFCLHLPDPILVEIAPCLLYCASSERKRLAMPVVGGKCMCAVTILSASDRMCSGCSNFLRLHNPPRRPVFTTQ